MMMKTTRLAILLAAALVLVLRSGGNALAQNGAGGGSNGSSAAPAAPREFRGAWVSSVNNGNWPSEPGLPVEKQKREILDILDRCAALNINAIVLQVRPAADALYPSELEPWSEYLTGVQGQPPSPMYDPLQMWIDEAHKRGLELHAWFNPYRVKSDQSKAAPAVNNIAKRYPDVVKQYGDHLWMDPGEPAAARHTLNVILDIVRRYDVDGVHTDDYYYPYQIKGADGKIVGFPDDFSWARYKSAGGKLSRDDWRRDNVNQLVQRLYVETRKLKPWVKVSYAPFGIWKSGVPAGTRGLSQYDALYADPKLWLNKGWLDFMSPQLYWKIGGEQDFRALLNWWLSENAQKRYVWPGMSVARHAPQEVLNQVEITRRNPLSTGQMLWSVDSVIAPKEKPKALYAALQRGPYLQKALVPAFGWLDRDPPPAPQATPRKDGGAVTVTLRPGAGEPTFVYSVFAKYAGQWRFTTVPGGAPSITLNADASGAAPEVIVVAAVDRCGNESPRVTVPVR